MRYVYLVRCNDDTLYTGITNDLEKRINDHNNSKTGAKYTKARRPVELVWNEEVEDKSAAAKLEYKIKRMTRTQKASLFQGGADEGGGGL